MKWNRDESNWTELKGRAKRQLYGALDDGSDTTNHNADQPLSKQQSTFNLNQDKTTSNMAQLCGQVNNIPSRDSASEASSLPSTG